MAENDSERSDGREAPSEHLSQFLLRLRQATAAAPAGGPASGSSGAERPDPSGRPGSPRFVGRYELVDELARGGMGVIYRVHDDSMRRTLAMKVLQGEAVVAEAAESGSSPRTSRFLEEAQVTGQLEHPGIIPVHEMGLDAHGNLFFTMRLVKGQTLGEVIELVRRGDPHWTLTRALGVILKVCEAMAFAHDKQVIHRDLKPANVMVGRFGETYVVDWGLAKVLGADPTTLARNKSADASMLSLLTTTRAEDPARGSAGSDSTHDTMEGDVLGTPAFMPPEQARGRIEEMGPKSDVYSVGAMLYHLLAGRAPFTSPDGRDTPLGILERVMAGPPAPLAQLAPNVPAELVAISERAMEREPARRYASMAALADDLHAYMEQRVVRAYETGPVAEFKKWVARNRGLAASVAAAIFVAIAGLAAVSYVQTKGRKELALTNVDLAHTNASLNTANAELAEARDRARANETLAHERKAEAQWQSYRANVSAAALLLEHGSAGEARNRLADCDATQRGWEWRYLDKLADSSLRVLRGHEGFVVVTAYSPDGRLLASGGGGPRNDDHSIRIWDTRTGVELKQLSGHANDVVDLAFSPAGTELVTSSGDGFTILWDVESGEELARVALAAGILAYHPDGRRVALGTPGGEQLSLWDTYENQLDTLEVRLPGGLACLRFFPDGRRLAVGGGDFKVRILDLIAGNPLGEKGWVQELDVLGGRPAPPPQPQLGNGVAAIDIDSRTGRLLTGASDGSLLAWDLARESVVVSFRGHRGGVRSARFHPDGPWVVSSDVATPVRFWQADSGAPLETLYGHEKWTLGLALSPTGDQVASASLDGTVRLWDGQPGSNVQKFFGAGGQGLTEIAFRPEGARLAWTPDLTRVVVGDASTGENLFALPRFASRVFGLGFDPAGARLVTIDGQGRVTAWDARSGVRLDVRPPSTEAPTTAAAFERGGARFATGSGDRPAQIRVYDTETLEPESEWQLPEEAMSRPGDTGVARYVIKLAFSLDGTLLAVLSGLTTISVWELDSGRLVHTLRAPEGVVAIAFDTTNEHLLTMDAYAGNSLCVLDLASGERLRAPGGHGPLTALSGYSPDGSRLAVGNGDGSVSLWDPEHGEMATLAGGGESGGDAGLQNLVGGVAFSPDGNYLASLEWNGTCHIWNLTPLLEREDERRAAARRRKFTREAETLVGTLFREHVLVSGVVEALQNDPVLKPDLRDAALDLARMQADDPARLIERARAIVLRGDGRPVDYLRALESSEYALALWPHARNYGIVVGAAQYRMGNDREALAALDSLAADNAPADERFQRLVFLALTQARLGQQADSDASLEQARRAGVDAVAAGTDAALVRALLAEAEAQPPR